MTLLTRRLAALALPALLLTGSPAHAGPSGIDTGFTLQGSIAYGCLGCSDLAHFDGVATYVGDYGVTTVPVTGDLSVYEDCTDQGGAYGVLRIGDADYTTSIARTGPAVTIFAYGPAGWYAPDDGAGTLTFDAPPKTCGGPVRASVTAALVPFFNCACYLQGGDD